MAKDSLKYQKLEAISDRLLLSATNAMHCHQEYEYIDILSKAVRRYLDEMRALKEEKDETTGKDVCDDNYNDGDDSYRSGC